MMLGNTPRMDVSAAPNAVTNGAALPRAVPAASTNGANLASPGAASPTALTTMPKAVPKASMIVPTAFPIPWKAVLKAEPTAFRIWETPWDCVANNVNEATMIPIPAPIPTAATATAAPNDSKVAGFNPLKPCKAILIAVPIPLNAVEIPVPIPLAACDIAEPAFLITPPILSNTWAILLLPLLALVAA